MSKRKSIEDLLAEAALVRRDISEEHKLLKQHRENHLKWIKQHSSDVLSKHDARELRALRAYAKIMLGQDSNEGVKP